jgi:hypothetical protein
LRSQRDAAGLSLRALAVRSGFSASYLTDFRTAAALFDQGSASLTSSRAHHPGTNDN